MAGTTMEMRLADVCFVHWPVDPDAMAAHVPDGTTVDTRDGRAWLSALGLRVRPRFLPTDGEYAQVNVRTYLVDDRPAVHFLDAVADELLAAGGGRVLTGIPVRYGTVSVDRGRGRIDVRCEAPGSGTFEMHLVPSGRPEPAGADSLAHWLVERYRYRGDDGSAGDIDHAPWRLQAATGRVTAKRLLADLPEPTGEPVFHYSPGVLVEA